MKFIDYAKVTIRSGNGGAGHISFRREKYVPKGGPDGGNGGRGGNVVFKADPQLNTLLDFRYKRHFLAKNGQPGGKYNCTGKSAEDLIIRVPCGTLIKESESDEIIADMTEPDSEYVVAQGGLGGRGNAEFVTSVIQAPRYAEPGIQGKEIDIILELKLIADVGIVGLPNVGKSTLISVISSAKPKIADYPFTTLMPNLGIVKIADEQNFTVADIPGLIEGASDGKGLGTQFLRHIERTRVLLFMIDCFSDDPKKDYKILNNELKKYNPELEFKQRLICFSRIDGIDEETKKNLSKMKFGTKKLTPILFSSVSGENVEKIKMAMWNSIVTINDYQY